MANCTYFCGIISLILYVLYGKIELINGDVIVDIPEIGSVRGSNAQTTWTNQTILQFLAIPFAESPSKELRFKAPVARSKWSGVLDATKFGRKCPQPAFMQSYSDEEDFEDCLHLCVYTKDVSQKRPVMVFIHGGALKTGSSAEHASNFLLEKDIVFVAVQYRLGALGFLSTRTKDIPGNMGILDAILALEWVQNNIKHFGGDPNHVTVFGESAGASISSLLAVSPKARNGLFHRVVLQSGSLFIPDITDKNPVENARANCVKFGCQSCDKIENINECLKNASLEKLVNANPDKIVPFGFAEFDFEGVIPTSSKKLVEESKNNYPVMAGINKHDGTLFFPTTDLDKTPRKYLDMLIEKFGEDNFSGTLGNLFSMLFFTAEQLNQGKINPKEMIPSYVDILSDMLFKCPTQHFLELYMGNSNDSSNYLYTFDYAGEHSYGSYFIKEIQKTFNFYPFQNGVHHADDLLYLFPWTKTLNVADTKMAKIMVDLWTSFAMTGKPQYENGIEILKVKNPMGPYFHINANIKIEDDFSEEFLVTKRENEANLY